MSCSRAVTSFGVCFYDGYTTMYFVFSDVDTDGLEIDGSTTVEEVVEFFVKEEITVIE